MATTPVFLLRESHVQRSLVGYSSRGPKELDMTSQLSMHIYINQNKEPPDQDIEMFFPAPTKQCSVNRAWL